MKTKGFFLLAGLLQIALPLSAQSDLPMPRNIRAVFDNGTRSPDGMPGKNYWQNSADYDIQVRFEPALRRITGSEEIIYHNLSPDTLRELVFKIYPNLYQKGAKRLMAIEPDDISDGLQIRQLIIGGAERKPSDYLVQGTNMFVRIPPLLPGASTRVVLSYSYVLNKNSHIRTGEVDSGAWFLAYFFPRIAVYDDIDGWNRAPYLGTQEFYNDFCNFKTAITVPKDYLVWATGDLLNCEQVLMPEYCARIASAERHDQRITIVDTSDLKAGGITAPNTENTFRFEAKQVTDFAVAISNHYVWKSTSLAVDKSTGRRTRVDAVFNPGHRDYYPVLEDARKTVEAMSFHFPRWPYPYAHETIFDGLDQMEYPMMVNDNPVENRAESIELTDHEIFHTMFPFYMGINETKYGWMDEGWATIGEWLISPLIDSTIVDEYGMARYEELAGAETDLPVSTLTTFLTGEALFINSYPKPALAYLYVKDMLGDELFFKSLHHYIRTWNGKHPIPYDFFYCINNGAGVNLNWFWKRWFFDAGVPDLAIAKVESAKKKVRILVESKGGKPVPVDLTITFEDGSVQKAHRSIAVWEKGNRQVEIEIPSSKGVQSVSLGSTYVPDVNKADNRFERERPHHKE